MAIKDEMNTEKQKLKNMTWKDRLWYINAYYRFHIIACILVIFLLITVGQTLYRKTFTTRLYISIINDKTQSAYTETLDALLQQGLDFGPKDLLEMDSSLYLSFDEQNMSQYHYASIAKLTALLASNTLDLVIADQEFIENYGKQAAFLNLEENLDSELYGQLSEDILEVKDEKGQTCHRLRLYRF